MFFALTIFLSATAYGATLTVTTTADGVAGSLRKAIQTAASGDTIVFQIPNTDPGFTAGYWTIPLTGATAANKTLVIDKDLTIDGSAQNIVVRRDSGAPTDFRIFDIPDGITATFIHLWISSGNVTTATGDSFAQWGAGIRNFGNLTVRECIFTGNVAGKGGGAIMSIFRINLARSTLSGNSAGTFGGAIYTGDLQTDTIDTCTFTDNKADEGGAIYINGGTSFIKSSTITGNTATSGAGGGGVVAHIASPHFENTIILGNTASLGPDVNGTVVSDGHNLVGSTANNSGFGGVDDQTSVTPAQAKLKPLSGYGGFTATMPPQGGSFAIDKGKRTTDANGQLVNTDQRGLPRQVDRTESNSSSGDASDIGAVEAGTPQAGPAFTVTTIAEHDDGECSSDDCTLLEALNVTNAVADANTINFAPTLVGPITTNLTPTGLAITNPVTINGRGSLYQGITGSSLGRVFRVTSSNVKISGFFFFNNKVTDADGGAILNTGGLTLTNCTINTSVAAGGGNGGGVHNASAATLNLVGCTFYENNAGQFGGGVFNDGTLTATNCTFINNSALRGGGLISRANGGASKATLRNCTITQNTATSTAAGNGDGGGGYFAEGAASQHFVGNCILAGNTNSVNPDVRGNITSDGHNLIGNVAFAVGFSNNTKGDQVGTPGGVISPHLDSLKDNDGSDHTLALLSNSSAINAGDDSLAPATDQRGYTRNGVSDIGAYEFHGFLPVTLANISTRLLVGTGDNVLIGGFILPGTPPKKVIIRAIGPSLPFPGRLENPTLELRNSAGALLASNDDWVNSSPVDKQAIIDSTIPPSNDLESAIVATLPGNNASYTAIVRGVDNGTGIGVVEAYDLDRTVRTRLANIATRGLVQAGDNVLIAGTIVLGSASQKVIIRAIGPSLPIAGKLENPTLELRDGSGTLLEANDNWVDSPNKQAIIDSTIPPGNDLESAIVRTLSPANYTAVVRGANDTTGIAVVEVYALN